MVDSNQREPSKEYEKLILQLPGVLNASVIYSDGVLSEIHVLADDSRAPKRIARDIQSAIAARYGIEIDYKIISIAQIPAQKKNNKRGRLVFDEISCIKNKEHSSVTVKLNDGEHLFSGSAAGLNDDLEIGRIICQATLEAVSNYIDGKVQLSAVDVKAFELGGEKALSVCVLAKGENRAEHLIGSAFSSDDVETAVVKATLDALNRRIAVV
jgi:hypothetical protein